MNIEDVLDEALRIKLQTDELIRLGDKLYVCMDCGKVSDYWEPGWVCERCEQRGERQQEDEHDR